MAWQDRSIVAVRVDVGPSIMLHSGAWFDFCAPSASQFTIDDVAHGLANICRYSGQCNRFYSVAEHSLLVSEVAEGFEYEALLHDAAEAFLGDITRPLKQMLPEYKKIEAEVENAIFSRFGIEGKIPPEVKRADLRVLAAEQQQIMPCDTDSWLKNQDIRPAPVTICHLSPDQAKQAWLERFHSLRLSREAVKSHRRYSEMR